MMALKKLLLVTSFACVITSLTACTTTGDPEQQKPNFTEASRTNVQIGMLMLQKGDTEMAKESFLRATTEAPHQALSWYALGYFYEATGNKKLADNYYQKAIQIAPHSGESRNNYGTFLCRNGQYEKAIKQFMAAVAEPNYTEAAKAYENAGVCAESIPHNQQQAIAYFKKAVENGPNQTISTLELARLYYQAGNKELARKYLSRYQEIGSPNDVSRSLAKKLKA